MPGYSARPLPRKGTAPGRWLRKLTQRAGQKRAIDGPRNGRERPCGIAGAGYNACFEASGRVILFPADAATSHFIPADRRSRRHPLRRDAAARRRRRSLPSARHVRLLRTGPVPRERPRSARGQTLLRAQLCATRADRTDPRLAAARSAPRRPAASGGRAAADSREYGRGTPLPSGPCRPPRGHFATIPATSRPSYLTAPRVVVSSPAAGKPRAADALSRRARAPAEAVSCGS